MNRRNALTLLGGGMTAMVVPLTGYAADEAVAEAMKDRFGERPLRQGRLTIKLPTLAESGNSVPISVMVESPMSPTDRVVRLSIFSTRNPRPLIATVTFGPSAGRAAFTTNIRLNGTQDVIAVAEMSDDSLWTAQGRVLVTVGACDALQTRR